MEESMNFSLEQEPSAEVTASKKPSGRMIAWIVGAAALCVVLAVGIVIVIAVLSAKTPLEKTVNAVFPSTELLGEMMTEGGTLTVEGELANDLLNAGFSSPICFSADYAFSLDGAQLCLTAGSKEDRIDLSVLADREGAQIYSDRLLGTQAYSVSFGGLADAIDASPFAPDSGTSYALPRDVYDMIVTYAEQLNEEPQVYEQTLLVYAEATEAMLAKADSYEKKETVSLLGGDTKAKVYSYTFREDAWNAFVDVWTDAWENNSAFREEIESLDFDGKMQSFVKNVFEELKMRDESFFEGFALTCKYAVKGGYLVYADALFSQEKDGEETETVFVALKFTEKPKKDPSYRVELSSSSGEETESRYLLSYRKSDRKEEWTVANEMTGKQLVVTVDYEEDDAFELTVKRETEAGEADDWGLEIEGTWIKTSKMIDFSVDGLKAKGKNGETQFEMKDSSFRVCLQSKKTEIARRKESTDILSMSVAQLNELGAKVEGSLIDALDSIGKNLGAEIVHETYMPNALATVNVESHLSDYAYDCTNGHLFFAYDCGTSGEIWMYDASTMELLDKLVVDDPVYAIDADNGYLVFAYDTTGQQTAYVHSSEDMAYIKSFDYMDHDTYYPEYEYPGDIAVDGDKLIYISGDQHVYLYFTDLKSDKTVRSESTYYQPKLTLDREQHVVALLENDLSACNLILFSTADCKRIETFDRFGFDGQYLSGAAHFDGEAFWATADEWYRANGTFGSLDSALGFETHGVLAQVVHRDENLIVTLEINENGEACTAFYLPDGSFCDTTDVLYLRMRPIDENHCLAVYQDGNKTVFAYCELAEGKTIG